jgi:hypothetical protein
MKKTLSAIVTAATLCLASQASAATIDFSTAGTGVGGATGLAGVTYSTVATHGTTLTSAAGTVNATQHGLGVGYAGDRLNNSSINSGDTRFDAEIGTWEMLTVTFNAAVNLVDFVMGRMDTNDDFEFSINGGAFTYVAPPVAGAISCVLVSTCTGSDRANPLNQLVTFAGTWTAVTSLRIRVLGVLSVQPDGSVGTTAGNDDFTLAAANVTAITPVPLPAGAPLLLAGLAGLAALRRRKRAA